MRRLLCAFAMALAGPVGAQDADTAYRAEAFDAAHADLPRSTGMPAQLANEAYVEALARLVMSMAG